MLRVRQEIKLAVVLTIAFIALQFNGFREGMKWLERADVDEVKQHQQQQQQREKQLNDAGTDVANPWEVAFQLAQRRFASRLAYLNHSYSDLKQKHKETSMLQQQYSPPAAILNSIRIPKAGSSHLSVIARALAGCHPDGYPCCKGLGSPPGSCPRPDLYCPVVTGCTDHHPDYSGNEPVITAFRHPTGRLLSSFFYVQPHRPAPISDHQWSTFEAFVSNAKYRNVMTKMLSVGDYAYDSFEPERHTVERAKRRLCHDMDWFGVNEWPILSAMLLYEMPGFQQLIPNPVVFGLPPVTADDYDEATNTTTEASSNATTTHVEATTDGLRENNDKEYTTFRSTLFVARNGSDLVESANAQDLELYKFACALFCARVHQQSGLIDAASAIAADEITKCLQILAGNQTVDSLCRDV